MTADRAALRAAGTMPGRVTVNSAGTPTGLTAKRDAMLENPGLLLAELLANSTFAAENPGCVLVTPPSTWALYADVLESLIDRANGNAE